MAEKVFSAGLGGDHKAADVWPSQEAVEELKVHEDPGLLPMLVPTFSPPLPPSPLARLPPHGASVAQVQWLQEKFDKLSELLTKMMGSVEKLNPRVGERERKVHGSLPQVGKNRAESKALGARVRSAQFGKYLLSHGLQPTMAPTSSAPAQTQTSHSFLAPSCLQPGPSIGNRPVPMALRSPHVKHQHAFHMWRLVHRLALGHLTMPRSTASASATHLPLIYGAKSPSPDPLFPLQRPIAGPISTKPCTIHAQTAPTLRPTPP